LKVTYTEEAIADIVDAITYLTERNPTAAVANHRLTTPPELSIIIRRSGSSMRRSPNSGSTTIATV